MKIKIHKKWHEKEHLFNAVNITKYEKYLSSKNKKQQSYNVKIKPRALNHSKVVWIMRDGKFV